MLTFVRQVIASLARKTPAFQVQQTSALPLAVGADAEITVEAGDMPVILHCIGDKILTVGPRTLTREADGFFHLRAQTAPALSAAG
jgi:hypothetical protein